ncbi:hypothetical protein SAMD00019534_097540, partial [Acytostelium subglobosum LB1]|uniref:hypothetical protein n=1 Tax=Acytostelium subglobosum LB1 TaxID=1410327 RepID=UPI000644AB4C
AIKLEAVLNFRNLGGMPIQGGKLVIRPGAVNRTASPTKATLSDEFWLLEALSIKTLIDFRTSWENKTISPLKRFEDNFLMFAIKKEDKESISIPASTGCQSINHSPKDESNNFTVTPQAPETPPAPKLSRRHSISHLGQSGDQIKSPLNRSINSFNASPRLSTEQPQTITSVISSTTTTTSSTVELRKSQSLAHSQSSPLQQSHTDGSVDQIINDMPTINVSETTTTTTATTTTVIDATALGLGIKEKFMEEQRNNIIWRIYNRNVPESDLAKMRRHSSGAQRKRYCIPLVNNRMFMEGVYQTAPPNAQLKCKVSRYLLFNDKVGALLLMTHLNDLGMLEMYKLTLIYTQEEILTIFRILKNKDNYPIMYFCSLGKDRTGMVTALLLSCLGVPRDLVVEDYSKSGGNLAAHLAEMRKYFIKVGLTKDEFVQSPRHIMADMLSWVDETYGSVPNYLATIGFSHEEQDELRKNLIITKEEYDQIMDQLRQTNVEQLIREHDQYVAEHQPKVEPKSIFSRALDSPKFWRRLSISKDIIKGPHD